MIRNMLVAAIAAIGAMGMAPAHAEYPDKPVRMVVGFPPGGGTDTTARFIAQKLSERSNSRFIVDNVPGANGSLGAAQVAAAPADGYTLMFGSSGILLINPNLYEDAGFTLDDFSPIVRLAYIRNIVLVHQKHNVKTAAELVTLAKSKPGELNYGSAGIGNAAHLAGELFQRGTGTEMAHIPYKGGAEAVTAFMGGDLDILFPSVNEASPLIAAGTGIPVALMADKRVDVLPDLPTLQEQGIMNSDMATWHSLVAPAGTPPEVIKWLNTELNAVLESDEAKEVLGRFGLTIAGGSTENFVEELQTERVTMDELVAIAKSGME